MINPVKEPKRIDNPQWLASNGYHYTTEVEARAVEGRLALRKLICDKVANPDEQITVETFLKKYGHSVLACLKAIQEATGENWAA